MDLLDRLLGHDRWTTAQLLERCGALRAEQQFLTPYSPMVQALGPDSD